MKTIFKIIITSYLLLYTSYLTNAQVAVNSDGTSPNASAMLDVTSTTKGILIPRMTTSEREAISSPATGLLVYDTDENSFWYYANATWINLSSAILSDADSDTKIQVEESADEDIIRFDMNGTEFMRLDSGRIEIRNTGNSIFIGKDAGSNDDYSDNQNIFIGDQAGYENTSGGTNVFIGSNAGYTNTTSGSNTFVGAQTGYYTTGGFNSFFGAFSGSSNSTGASNTFIGNIAGSSNTTGSYNLYLGSQAGYSNKTGSNNVFLGYQAGLSETSSNKLYIENSFSSSPLIYGEFDNDLLQINGTLNIKGKYAFPTADGNASQILTTDGSGTLSWADMKVDSLSDSDGDTKILVEESSDEDIIRFDLGGTEFMRLDSGRINILNTGSSIFIGNDAGASDDFTDNHNIFIGEEAGLTNTTGVRNILLGYRAGYSNISGSRNTFLGYKSGFSTTTEGRNTFLGYESGYSNQTGKFNVFLGYQAGYNETGSDKLYIENSNSTSPLIFGDFDADSLQINGKLNISGNYNFPTTDGSASQVLTTDGNGTLTWIDQTVDTDTDDQKIDVFSFSNNTLSISLENDGQSNSTLNLSSLELSTIQDSDSDTKIQVEESSDEDIIRFDLGGTEFLKLDNGRIEIINTGNSVFLGEGAGANDDLSDNYNVFIGNSSGYSTTTGNKNVFLGYHSGEENIIGISNVFIGYNAGKYNTASYNTFIGSGAGDDNTTGYQNTFLGTRSGYSNTDGNENIFIGYDSGYENETGDYNVYLGTEAGYNNVSGYQNVFLGHKAGFNETGNEKLYIENSTTSSPLIWGDFSADRVVIDGNDGDNTNDRTFFVNGDIGATSAFNNDSDRRLKTNIQTIPNALNKILEMRGVTYQWKDGRETGNRMGFIAQEVEPILPEVVDNKNDHYTMQYAPITAVLVEAMKELKSENDQLKQKVESLETELTEINQLKAQLEKVNILEAKLEALLNNR